MTNTLDIIKCDTGHVELVSAQIIALLAGFNERSGSNFSIDKAKVTNTCYQFLKKEECACYMAHREGIPIGLITLSPGYAIYNGGAFGVISELYVAVTYRSQGVGKALLKKAYEHAYGQGWTKLEVGAPNAEIWPRTIAFYKDNGFKEKGPKLRVDL